MQLTVIEPLDGSRLCKRRLLAPDGTVIKIAEDRLTRGRVSVWPVQQAGQLGLILDSMTRQSIVLGIPNRGAPGPWWLVTKDQMPAGRQDVIARSLEYLDWPDGPGWLLVDFDQFGGGVREAGAALAWLWPEIAEASILLRPSTSNVHAFVLVGQPREAPMIIAELARRAASVGYPELIDVSVASPERLVYVAPPILMGGLARNSEPSWWQEGCAIGMAGLLPVVKQERGQAPDWSAMPDPAGWDLGLHQAVAGYVLSVVHGLCAELRIARRGGRSNRLFAAGARLGSFAWTKTAALAGAGDLLLEAAEQCGYYNDYGRNVAVSHLARGFEQGAGNPEGMPVIDRWDRRDEILAMGAALMQRMYR